MVSLLVLRFTRIQSPFKNDLISILIHLLDFCVVVFLQYIRLPFLGEVGLFESQMILFLHVASQRGGERSLMGTPVGRVMSNAAWSYVRVRSRCSYKHVGFYFKIVRSMERTLMPQLVSTGVHTSGTRVAVLRTRKLCARGEGFIYSWEYALEIGLPVLI